MRHSRSAVYKPFPNALALDDAAVAFTQLGIISEWERKLYIHNRETTKYKYLSLMTRQMAKGIFSSSFQQRSKILGPRVISRIYKNLVVYYISILHTLLRGGISRQTCVCDYVRNVLIHY